MLTAQAARRPGLTEAYAFCRRITLGHNENFPIVSWLLPRPLRRHMYAVYAYCRGVDDLGDEAEGDRHALLDEWDRELRACYDGEPSDTRFVALQDTIRRFNIPREPFLRLVEANRRDQTVTRYGTFAELLEYCSYSANPVGELVLWLFGYSDERRRRFSDATCTALQLANFWQDVSRDLDKGRIYIPQEDMERFGYTEAELTAREYNRGLRRLMRFQVKRTRQYFQEGLGLLPLVSGRLRYDLKLFSLGGLAVLDAIERARYDVLTSRPEVGRQRKAALAVRGLLPVPIRASR
ncbi:MAG TPA: squalene synthase HpnC [Dehalococcoidia bacterium]|nr:squalene synthase HpnC [Dehalococcoidia bacterium]